MVYVTGNQNLEMRVKNVGFWVFRIFKMIARCSKYDFWIPGKILDWYRKNIFQKHIFSISKNLQEKNKVVFFMIFYDFSRFSMVSLSKLLRETIENLEKSWKIMKNKILCFSRKKMILIFFENIFSISIQNFPRNPKIILRNPCENVYSKLHILNLYL